MQKFPKENFFFLFFAVQFLLLQNIFPQDNRETRAVWVSTNFRLDWPPPTFDQEKQKQSLIKIFDDIKSKNLNTVYFQVRSNGTVLFNSSFEAVSSYLTGKIGVIGAYDPLAFAIEQAHKRGLEIHAWINTVLCFAGAETSTLNDSNHIFMRKPEWVVEDNREGNKSYWLDPGLPEVREYLSDLIEEMIQNYDVDGVQLDFIRYPGKNFGDDFSYNVYGSGIPKDDWRRNNITTLIELAYKKIKAVKPVVKVGAAPIGVYKNHKGMYGWEGYSEIYQDSREWLRRGILDYVAPQIYWSFDENTSFDLLAKEWVEYSYGRNVVLGIGAYKENVMNDIEKMIDYSRTINASGIAFFRYGNIRDYQFKNFRNKTYPAEMAWLDGIKPEPPQFLSVEKNNADENLFSLHWQVNENNSNDSIKYFALYNLPHAASEILPDYLFDLIPSDKNSITLGIEKPKKNNYYFTLRSVSKLWNESIETSNVVEVNFPELNLLAGVDDVFTNPVLIKEKENKAKILIYSKLDEEIEISGFDSNGNRSTAKAKLRAGKNILALQLQFAELSLLKIKYLISGKEVELKL
ncbi:MAG: family 10 glycosylhydrolase [Ignavibacteriales bacterium]|nr:family 10 glycosylhydrolase [Ignavibacteriales bacterium]